MVVLGWRRLHEAAWPRQVADFTRQRGDIPAAERIVSEEVERFWAWYSALVVVPVLKELRDHMERIRAAELERALRRLPHLKSDDRAQLEQFSHALLNQFLHQPTIALKEAASAGRGYALLEALKRLFGLERRESHDLKGQQAAYPDQRLHR
jgi:glutamyl-tRNA reductase